MVKCNLVPIRTSDGYVGCLEKVFIPLELVHLLSHYNNNLTPIVLRIYETNSK